MRSPVALRLFGLAALALVGATIALATSRHHGTQSATAAAGDWYRALASASPLVTTSRRTVCGRALDANTLGVAHPVLPCNVKVYIEFEGKTVLTEVIDRGPSVSGREFALTHALAEQMGLHGTQSIRWRFATAATN
ncbi:MAG: RlpA-like double-psi beta-barrel domain-containing protein [Gaiellaceae bacterium]